ncbi:MAG TPA: hypothetical protein VFH24_05540 [Gemmatimonadales bacterium]|nr:hypothetical protein [Gemmatimonadales bacterium]
MARFREAERLALLRPVDFRPAEREDLRALFRAELRPPRLADLLDFFADRRALFLAPLRVDFRLLLLADRLADFLRVADFLRDPPLLDRLVPPVRLLGEGSSNEKDEGDDAGEEGEGVLSEGSGSIQPEPDQPISI